MITMQNVEFTVRNSNLQALLWQTDAVRAMAVQIVAGQVEGHLDMISDAGVKEYSTYEEVDACIQGAKESVKDYIEDMIAEFRSSLLEEIAKIKIETKAVLLKKDDIDADVEVTISK
jgi:hypothetical protein